MSFFTSVSDSANEVVYRLRAGGAAVCRRLNYYPSLLRLVLTEGPENRWYDRVDSTVILGALPFRSQTEELVEEENVKAVLSYAEGYELRFFTNSKEQWAEYGVRQFHFSTIDHNPPSLSSIIRGLRIIDKCKLKNRTVYLHCKAGKGRSVVVAICYLMKAYDLTFSSAIEYLQSKRPQININQQQMQRVVEFFKQLNQSKHMNPVDF